MADRPSQKLARRLVVASTGLWTLGAAIALLPENAIVLAIVIAIMTGFVVFYTVSQVAAEGTEFRPFDYWNVPWGGRAPLSEKHRVTLNLLSRTWWTEVVDATGWPPALVWGALGASLFVSVFVSLTQW